MACPPPGETRSCRTFGEQATDRRARERGQTLRSRASGVTLLKGDLRAWFVRSGSFRPQCETSARNLFFPFIYNALGVPVAAGVPYRFFGIFSHPLPRRRRWRFLRSASWPTHSDSATSGFEGERRRGSARESKCTSRRIAPTTDGMIGPVKGRLPFEVWTMDCEPKGRTDVVPLRKAAGGQIDGSTRSWRPESRGGEHPFGHSAYPKGENFCMSPRYIVA